MNQDEALLDVVRGIRTVLEAQMVSNTQKSAHHSTPSSFASVCNIPYTRNPFFTNREQTLKQLHSTFRTNKFPAMARALSGMSGVGKTQTAVEYAYRHREDYQHVLWRSSSIPEYVVRLQYQAVIGHDAWDRLPDIHAPTLVIHGSEDQQVPTANASLLAERIPRVQRYIVKGGRHAYFVEKRSEASGVVNAFLARHPLS
jgi:pimeloyl-ACP methyl ester carboxylesterase